MISHNFSDDNFNQTHDWVQTHQPSHEQYEDWNDPNGKIWSSVAFEKVENDENDEMETVYTKRAIFALDPKTKKREVVGEWHYSPANITKCTGKNQITLAIRWL